MGRLTNLGMIALLYAFQTRHIFPGSASQGTPEARLDPRPGVELLTLTSAKGNRVVAAFGAALDPDGNPLPNAAERPSLLYFYGNGMWLSLAADYDLEHFRRLGMNVLIPDYIGYGLSGGEPGERSCYETAETCYQHLVGRPDINPDLVIVGGRSLGGAVAIDLAARKKVAGLFAFCTFTRMTEMAKKRFPLLPASLLLRHRFDSIDKIKGVTCPILLGHGSADSVVPAEMSASLAVAASTSAPVTIFTVRGADHNDFYEVGSSQIDDALTKFLAGIASRESASRQDIPS